VTAALPVSAADGSWEIDLLKLAAVPALIALNAFFVAAEFSLVAVRRTRAEELARRGVKGAKALEAALQRIDRSIAATQLGITLASIALGFAGEPALEHLLLPVFLLLPEAVASLAAASAAWTLAFLAITFLHVVFGELIPKTLTLQHPDRVALLLARPLVVFARLTRPLIVLMNGTASAILRLFGRSLVASEGHVHSVEELLLLIEDTEEAGILDPEQAEVVENVFRLSGKKVRDCLVPRDKMAALELNTLPEKVLEAARTGAHTRMPVYEGELDNIVGIVNTKDLFYLFSLKGVVVLQDALYPPLFLRPDESVAKALQLFKKAHRPMALVRDENGKILGLITLEDVLEEIVGDIEDEHDRPTPKVKLRRGLLLPRPAAPAAGKPPADNRGRPGGS
jgi:CBS domain containing-hemolysin-like protein